MFVSVYAYRRARVRVYNMCVSTLFIKYSHVHVTRVCSCMYVCMYVFLSLCLYLCLSVCLSVCLCVCVCVCVFASARSCNLNICMCA